MAPISISRTDSNSSLDFILFPLCRELGYTKVDLVL